MEEEYLKFGFNHVAFVIPLARRGPAITSFVGDEAWELKEKENNT